MAAVRFAFGAKPGMSGDDARQLAELMLRSRTLAHNRVAEKLLAQANVDVDANETSEDIELDRGELDALAMTLAEEPWAQEQEWFEHLRVQVGEARALS